MNLVTDYPSPITLPQKEQAKLGTALMGAGNYTYRKEW